MKGTHNYYYHSVLREKAKKRLGDVAARPKSFLCPPANEKELAQNISSFSSILLPPSLSPSSDKLPSKGGMGEKEKKTAPRHKETIDGGI